MRRNDREITEISQLIEIIEACKTCHLGMIDGNRPYVVPLSFGYEMKDKELVLYLHCAHEGRKLDILRKNSLVCFEMSSEGEAIYVKEAPCNSGYFYSSLIGEGNVEFVNDPDEKCYALSLIVKKQEGADITFTKEQASTVCVLKIVSDRFTGKKKNKPNRK